MFSSLELSSALQNLKQTQRDYLQPERESDDESQVNIHGWHDSTYKIGFQHIQ